MSNIILLEDLKQPETYEEKILTVACGHIHSDYRDLPPKVHYWDIKWRAVMVGNPNAQLRIAT